MTDLEKLKYTLKSIGCNFTSSPTLYGTSVTIYSERRNTDFEFDHDGKFKRVT